MSCGYVKLYRQLQENDIWEDDEPFDKRSAWVDLLLSVNRTDKEVYMNGKAEIVHAGQRITSIRKLAERWHWSKNKVERYTDELEKRRMITKTSDTRRTLITIVNWAKYQVCDSESGTPTGHLSGQERDTSEPQTRSKEVKKKEIKEKDVSKDTSQKKSGRQYSDDPAVDQAIRDFIDYRKKVKKAEMTERALTSMLAKLMSISTDPAEQVRLIDYAMEHNWMTVYPIRESDRAAPEPVDQAAYDHLNKVLDEMEASGHATW